MAMGSVYDSDNPEQPQELAGDDWFTQNAPPASGGVGPTTSGPGSWGGQTDYFPGPDDLPKLPTAGIPAAPSMGAGTPTNPVGSGIPWAPGATQPSSAPPGFHWDPNMANFVADAPGSGGDGDWIDQALKAANSTDDPAYWHQVIGKDPNGSGSAKAYWLDRIARGDGAEAVKNGTLQKFNDSPSGNWGGTDFTNPPSPYTSPTWTGGDYKTLDKPDWLKSPYVLPTLEELMKSPGYEARLAAGLQARNRSAAARGTVLNGGTQQALARYGQDYASNEYSNLVSQTMGARKINESEYQADDANAFRDYMTRYGQFRDFSGDSRTDYALNTTTQRNAKNDYWSHLNDLYQTGAQGAYGSYKPGVTL